MLDSVKVEKFIKEALKYNGDKYSQPRRMDKGYSDCSSIVYKGLRDAGLLDLSQTQRTISTKFMRDGDPRMYQIPMGDLRRGDIVWWQKPNYTPYYGHVGVYLGDGKVLEAIKPRACICPKSRLAWQRAYRIKSLETDSFIKKPAKKDSSVAENIPLIINGKEVKRVYSIDGITYMDINKKSVPVRKTFEAMGAVVKWQNNQVEISL